MKLKNCVWTPSVASIALCVSVSLLTLPISMAQPSQARGGQESRGNNSDQNLFGNQLTSSTSTESTPNPGELIEQTAEEAKLAPFQKNVHYRVLKNSNPLLNIEAPSTLRPNYAYRVNIVEFFSYACHWCDKVEPALREWENKEKPAYVQLVKIPTTFQRGWDTLGKLHYVAENLKEKYKVDMSKDIFNAIHRDKTQLTRVDKAAEFLANYVYEHVLRKQPEHKGDSSIQADKVKREYQARYFQALKQNASVDTKLSQGNSLASQFKIHAIPTFIVGGFYETNIQMAQGDNKQLTEILTFLSKKTENIIKNEITSREYGNPPFSDRPNEREPITHNARPTR